MPLSKIDITKRLKQIKLLLLDVDGVLTDGSIIYNDAGEETKQFHAKDGLGLRLLMKAGIGVGIVTGRRAAAALVHRCDNLGIKLVFDDIHDKAAALAKISTQTGIETQHIAFVGDDLLDLPIMIRVGLAVAVADACSEVRQHAHFISTARGGRGAVREICETILKAKGLWPNIMEQFTQ